MENSLVKSGGTENSKRSRSLDIQSLYKKGVSKNEKRKGGIDRDGDLEKNERKKKSRKEAVLSSFEEPCKESRSSLDEARDDGASSNKSPQLKGHLGNFLDKCTIKIPKRPRGFVGRKKSENNHVSSPPLVGKIDEVVREQVPKSVRPSGRKVNSIDKIDKSNGADKGRNGSLSDKEKLGVDGNKKSSSSKQTCVLVPKVEEEVNLAVNNKGDAFSFNKRRSKHRKSKGSENRSLKMLVDSHEDEENLEETAARMLSSRFDPSCTQSSAKSRSPSTNGLSSLMVSDEDFVSRRVNMLADSEVASDDLADRVLRPRKKLKGDNISKKRRYFYELFYEDSDAFWVLNKRIKVFWPLDESWYYGSISDYSPEKKLHHIKYDDRDEEWIDLQNEKFKLLLLPSEVLNKTQQKGDASEKKIDDCNKKDLPSNDSLESSYMDSEPIIAWLGRSSRQVKSSLLGSSKRHKTSHLSPKLSHKLPMKGVCTKEHREKSDSTDKLNCNLAPPDRSSCISRDGKSLVVYVRRRFRKKDKGLIGTDNKASGRTSIPPMPIVPNGLDHTMKNDISIGLVESERLLLSVCNVGLLKLTSPVVDCIRLRLELGEEDFWWLRALFLLKYGTVMKLWPKVHLEILFVDNVMGLQFLLFEGSLKQAVEFVLLVMAIFNRSDQKLEPVDLPMPKTSIMFKLSFLEDSRRRHVFAVYSFLGVKCSKWLYLNSKLLQHCVLAKQLPLSECTYDNIKALGSGTNQMPLSSRSRASSANESLWKESLHGIMPKENYVHTSDPAADLFPSKCNVKRGELLPFTLSFSAAPSFFLSLHLKLLMDNNVASTSLHGDESRYSPEHSGKSCHIVPHDCTLTHENTTNVWEASLVGDSGISLGEVDYLKCTCAKPTLELEVASKCSVHGPLPNSHQNDKCNVAYASAGAEDSEIKATDAIVQLEIETDEIPVVGTPATAIQSSDMASNDKIVRSIKANEPSLMWHNGSNMLSPSHVRPGRKPEFIQNGFSCGPKKPRTQVQYSVPSAGLDSRSKHNSRRFITASDKRALEVSKNLKRNKGFLACDANLLITTGEKGWRECGARVELENAGHNEWRLSVKLSGTTKFSHKAHQFLQPGSTNRYTHAMMWRVEKDWALEFPDRNQWMLFKEMHAECFNRNLRAASVRNIPIPGVRLMEESYSNGTEPPFFRSSSDYFRQVDTDAEMAMDPSHILYDMDSEDERWISGHLKCPVHGSGHEDVSEELFERTMDMLEKIAFSQQRDNIELDEVEEFMVEIGPIKSIRSIHEHWQKKRLRKGMPLIRHLQPPLWESYQQRVKEWEKAVARANNALSSGCHDRAPPLEKPPMFAFCLKPRGLEMKNKGTKQRSHRRYPVSGNNYSLVGDHDSFYGSGQRSNGYAYGDEKVMYLGNSHELSDTSPSFKPSSTRVFSPRDAGVFGQLSLSNDSSERPHYPKFYKNKAKNVGLFQSPNNGKTVDPYDQRAVGKRTGVNRMNMGLSQKPSQRHKLSDASLMHDLEQLDGTDLDEFQLRDASGAAQHALNMARLKREKAQRLLYRADLAIHKAVVALMTAEAIKASSEDLNDDDESDDDESTEDDDSSNDDSNDNDSESESTR